MTRLIDMCVNMILSTLLPLSTHVGAKHVCYKNLGCFDDKLTCNKRNPLPEKPQDVDTNFFLYTRENSKPEVLRWDENATIIESYFKGDRRTIFIIHGYTSKIEKDKTFLALIKALLSKENLNVIAVSWKRGAEFRAFSKRQTLIDIFAHFIVPSYLRASENTRLVGRQIGELSHKLNVLTKASYADMYLIGHSLGAQVAGFAGEHLSRNYSEKYGRITGLDPAGPSFQLYTESKDCILDKTDASFMDIIHTDGFLGDNDPVGHQDFYPNGGEDQGNCWTSFCDHHRSIEYFIESITSSCEWLAYPCSSWDSFEDGDCRKCGQQGCAKMGFHAHPSAGTGKFMLGTNRKAPYCRKDSDQPPSRPSFWNIFNKKK